MGSKTLQKTRKEPGLAVSKPPQSKLMRDLLSDEELYGNLAPKWVQGMNQQPSMTYAEAVAESNRLIKILRRHGKDNPEALRLALKCEACSPQNPCEDGACVVCTWVCQRFWVREASAEIKDTREKMVTLSVMLPGQKYREGKLDGDLFEGLRERSHEAVRACGIDFGFGAFDLSANEHEDHRFPPHYPPHLWFLVPERAFRGAETLFRSSFPRSKLVPRPVVCKTFDGNLAGLAYAMKTSFVRRVSLTPKKIELAQQNCTVR